MMKSKNNQVTIAINTAQYQMAFIFETFICWKKNKWFLQHFSILQFDLSINSIMNRPKSALTLSKRIQIQRPKSSYRKQKIIFPQRIIDTSGGSYFATQADFEDFNTLKFSKAIQRFANKSYSTTRGLFYNVNINPSKSDYGSILNTSRMNPSTINKKDDIKIRQILKPCRKITKKSINLLKNSLEQIRKQTSCINDFVRSYTQNYNLSKRQGTTNAKNHRNQRNGNNKFYRHMSNLSEVKQGSTLSGESFEMNKQNYYFSVKGNKYVERKENKIVL